MTKSELAVLFLVLNRSKFFIRDTALLFETLDNLEMMNRRFKCIGRVSNRRGKEHENG